MCYRAGENSQIRALADALGWPYEVKELRYRWSGLSSPTSGAAPRARHRPRAIQPSRTALARSDHLRRHAQRAGLPLAPAAVRGPGALRPSRQPWAPVARFDLVITVPEYPVPDAPNVLRNSFSLHRVTEAEPGRRGAHLGAAPGRSAAALRRRSGGRLQRALCPGPGKGRASGREASALASERGGSLLVTTSGRTSRAAGKRSRARDRRACRLFRWARSAADNPYYGYLALADAIIVTCESATMLAEACATRKPVYMFDLDRDDDPALGRRAESWRRRLRRAWSRCNLQRLKARLSGTSSCASRRGRSRATSPASTAGDRLRARGVARTDVSARNAGAGGRPGALGARVRALVEDAVVRTSGAMRAASRSPTAPTTGCLRIGPGPDRRRGGIA